VVDLPIEFPRTRWRQHGWDRYLSRFFKGEILFVP
jgi:hypothetical protein